MSHRRNNLPRIRASACTRNIDAWFKPHISCFITLICCRSVVPDIAESPELVSVCFPFTMLNSAKVDSRSHVPITRAGAARFPPCDTIAGVSRCGDLTNELRASLTMSVSPEGKTPDTQRGLHCQEQNTSAGAKSSSSSRRRAEQGRTVQ